MFYIDYCVEKSVKVWIEIDKQGGGNTFAVTVPLVGCGASEGSQKEVNPPEHISLEVL